MEKNINLCQLIQKIRGGWWGGAFSLLFFAFDVGSLGSAFILVLKGRILLPKRLVHCLRSVIHFHASWCGTCLKQKNRWDKIRSLLMDFQMLILCQLILIKSYR